MWTVIIRQKWLLCDAKRDLLAIAEFLVLLYVFNALIYFILHYCTIQLLFMCNCPVLYDWLAL